MSDTTKEPDAEETDQVGRPVLPDTAAVGTIDGEEAVPIPVSMLTREQLLWAFRFRLMEAKSIRTFGLQSHERIISLIPGRRKFEPEGGKTDPDEERKFLSAQATRWFNQSMTFMKANSELAKSFADQFDALDRHASRAAELEDANKELERLLSEARKQAEAAAAAAEENKTLKARILDLEDTVRKFCR